MYRLIVKLLRRVALAERVSSSGYRWTIKRCVDLDSEEHVYPWMIWKTLASRN